MPKIQEEVTKKKTRIPEQAERGEPKKVKAPIPAKVEKKQKSVEREIVYPKPGSSLYAVGSSSGPLTAEVARELLGWEEVKKEFSREVNSLTGHKVILGNNISNRPIYTATVLTLKQEILRGRWQLNGEPIILGKTGLILNGQHSLLALIAAHEEWENDPDTYSEWGKGGPTMDKFVIVGIDESDDIVNTMDTCKPRSLADVIYRSKYFENLASGDRRKCAKICDYAVRMIWNRTGTGEAFAVRRTHSESLAFIENHPKLLECVKFCYEEEGEAADKGKISCYINIGFAASLMYLMGSSASDPSTYQDSDVPNEDMLNWDNWDKACDFWVSLAASEQSTSGLKKFYNAHLREHGAPTLREKCYMLAKAWRLFAETGSTKGMDLKYEENEDGIRCLTEFPTTGGIDIGEPGDAVDTARSKKVVINNDDEEEEPEVLEEDDGEEEQAETQTKKSKVANPKKAIAIGTTVWVREDKGGHWRGTLKKINPKTNQASVSPLKGVAGYGKDFAVGCDQISLKEPE